MLLHRYQFLQSIYNPVLIACYNLFFTSLPVLAMGIFDQDLDDVCSMKYAKLYIPGQYNLFFNMRIFIYSVLHGMIRYFILSNFSFFFKLLKYEFFFIFCDNLNFASDLNA